MKVDFSLVIPFYNEEENVENVCREIVEEFGRRGFTYELIAVNNGSRDGTANLLGRLSTQYLQVKLVNVDVNQGYGFGVLQGLKMTTGEYVGYSTGDGQISSGDVADVFERTKRENLDFCQGKRIRKDRFLRRLNTKGFNFVFHMFFPSPVHDIGSNPKIMRKTVYERIRPVSKDWFIDGEIILKNYLLKSRMKEFPVAFRKREKGKSHINFLSIFEMLKNIVKWRLKAGYLRKSLGG